MTSVMLQIQRRNGSSALESLEMSLRKRWSYESYVAKMLHNFQQIVNMFPQCDGPSKHQDAILQAAKVCLEMEPVEICLPAKYPQIMVRRHCIYLTNLSEHILLEHADEVKYGPNIGPTQVGIRRPTSQQLFIKSLTK